MSFEYNPSIGGGVRLLPQPTQPNFLAALGGLSAIEESCEVGARHASLCLTDDLRAESIRNSIIDIVSPNKAASTTFQAILVQIQELENTEAIRRSDQRLQAMRPARMALRAELDSHAALLDKVQHEKVKRVMETQLYYETSVLRKLAPSDQPHGLCFQPSEYCENAALRSMLSPKALALAEEARNQRRQKEAEEWLRHPQRMKEPGELARKFVDKLDKALIEEKQIARERALKHIRAVEAQQQGGSPARMPRKLPTLSPASIQQRQLSPFADIHLSNSPTVSDQPRSPATMFDRSPRVANTQLNSSRRMSTSLLNASATGRRLDGARQARTPRSGKRRSIATSSGSKKGKPQSPEGGAVEARRLSIQSQQHSNGSGNEVEENDEGAKPDGNSSSSDEAMDPFQFEGENDDIQIEGKSEAERIEDEWFKGLRRTASLKGFSRPGSSANGNGPNGGRPLTGGRVPLPQQLNFHESNFGLRSIKLRSEDLKAEIEALAANPPSPPWEGGSRSVSYANRSFGGAPPSPFLSLTSKGLADQLPDMGQSTKVDTTNESPSAANRALEGDGRPASAARSLRDVKQDMARANDALNPSAARQRPNTSGPMQSKFRRGNNQTADSIYTRRPASAMELVRHYRMRMDELSAAGSAAKDKATSPPHANADTETAEGAVPVAPGGKPPTSPSNPNISQLADLNREVSLFDRAARLNHYTAGLEDGWWRFHKQLDAMASQHPLPLEPQAEETRETRAAATKDRVDYATIRSYARAHTPQIHIRTADQLASMLPIEEPLSMQAHRKEERLERRQKAKIESAVRRSRAKRQAGRVASEAVDGALTASQRPEGDEQSSCFVGMPLDGSLHEPLLASPIKKDSEGEIASASALVLDFGADGRDLEGNDDLPQEREIDDGEDDASDAASVSGSSDSEVDMGALIDQILFGDIPTVESLGKMPLEARVATLTPSRVGSGQSPTQSGFDIGSSPPTRAAVNSTFATPPRTRPATQDSTLKQLKSRFDSSAPPPTMQELMPMVEGTGANLTSKATRLLKSLDMRNRCARTLQRFARKYILEPLREEERLAGPSSAAFDASFQGSHFETIAEQDLGMSGTDDIFGVKIKAPKSMLTPLLASSALPALSTSARQQASISPRRLSGSMASSALGGHSANISRHGRPPPFASISAGSKPPLAQGGTVSNSSITRLSVGTSPTLSMAKRATGPNRDDAEEAAILRDESVDPDSYQALAEDPMADSGVQSFLARLGTAGSNKSSGRKGVSSASFLRNHNFARDGQNFENILDTHEDDASRVVSTSLIPRQGAGSTFSDIHGGGISEDEASRPNTAQYSPRAMAERSALATGGSKRPASGARLKWAGK